MSSRRGKKLPTPYFTPGIKNSIRWHPLRDSQPIGNVFFDEKVGRLRAKNKDQSVSPSEYGYMGIYDYVPKSEGKKVGSYADYYVNPAWMQKNYTSPFGFTMNVPYTIRTAEDFKVLPSRRDVDTTRIRQHLSKDVDVPSVGKYTPKFIRENFPSLAFFGDMGKSLVHSTFGTVRNALDRSNQPHRKGEDVMFRHSPIDPSLIYYLQEVWRFCFLSYRPFAGIPGYEIFNFVTDTSFRGKTETEQVGYFAYSDDDKHQNFIFAFRGTQSQIEMVEDVHSGAPGPVFTKFGPYALQIPVGTADLPGRRIQQLESQLIDAIIILLEANVQDIGQIVVTGHSLGGGAAEVFIAILVQILSGINPQYLDKLHFVTFESMRGVKINTAEALERKYSGFFGTNSVRVYNPQDPVPNLPPFAAGYQHLGRPLLIGSPFTDFFESGKGKNVFGSFDVDTGPHSMRPTTEMLRNVVNAFETQGAKVLQAPHIGFTTGRGKMKKTRNRESSLEMKRKMAWVRSFKKKK